MQRDHNNLSRYAALIDTERMVAAIDRAQGAVRELLHRCPGAAISLSGGKDSVAAAIIARSVAPAMPIVIAHPPNPLPYRQAHVADLKSYFGGRWIELPYGWDVDQVMRGRLSYPSGLKVRTLIGAGIDGYVLGLRAGESRARMINHRMRGTVYNTASGWRCLPVATWTAEQVIGIAAIFGAPIAEPYRLPLLGLHLDDIRDGTWWAHRVDATADDWMRRSYPSCHGDWARSAEITLVERKAVF